MPITADCHLHSSFSGADDEVEFIGLGVDGVLPQRFRLQPQLHSEEAAEVLRECGFQYYCVFEKRNPEFHKLIFEKRLWGKGVGSQAARLFCQEVFSRYVILKLGAFAYMENVELSQRLLQRDVLQRNPLPDFFVLGLLPFPLCNP